MKVDPGKFHILLSNKQTEKVKINDVVLKSRAEEKLLGITLDPEFKFETHITNICNKASQKSMFCPELQFRWINVLIQTPKQ